MCVVGCGHVGLVWAAVLAASGYQTHAFDIDAKKIEILKEGGVTFFEPGLEKLVEKVVEEKRLIPTLNCEEAFADADFIFIAVSVGVDTKGEYDLSQILSTLEKIGKYSKKSPVIVIRSTVPPGSCRSFQKFFMNAGKPDFAKRVIYNPEFLREGSALYDTFFCDRVIIAGAEKERESLKNVYENIFVSADSVNFSEFGKYINLYIPVKNGIPKAERSFFSMDFEEAEIAKIGANAFLAMKISYANSIANLCDECNANGPKTLEAIGADKRIGAAFLKPGPGYGGSCLPKDIDGICSLMRKNGQDTSLFEATKRINNVQVDIAMKKIEKKLGSFSGQKIALLGLSFKPGTDDINDSQAVKILKVLVERNVVVHVFDPQAGSALRQDLNIVKFCSTIAECVSNSDLVIIATEWEDFEKNDLLTTLKEQKKLWLA